MWICWCRYKRTVFISILFKFCIWHSDYLVHIGAELDAVVSQKPTILLVRRSQILIGQNSTLLWASGGSQGPFNKVLTHRGWNPALLKPTEISPWAPAGLGSLPTFSPIHLRGVQIQALVLHWIRMFLLEELHGDSTDMLIASRSLPAQWIPALRALQLQSPCLSWNTMSLQTF